MLLFCPGLPEWAGARETIVYINLQYYNYSPQYFWLVFTIYCGPMHLSHLSSNFSHPPSIHVLVCLHLGLVLSTTKAICFLLHPLSSFCSMCPYHRNLLCCKAATISSNPHLSLSSTPATILDSFTSHTDRKNTTTFNLRERPSDVKKEDNNHIGS